MKLSERFGVREEKVRALRARIERLKLDVEVIKETFIRGGGKGGQKKNKSSHCVQLRYPPLGLTVRCQRSRRRTVNRFLALRDLVDRIELLTSPSTSERLAEIERERKRKARRRRRSVKKHQGGRSG